MSKTIQNNRQSQESNKENINYPNNYSDKKTSQNRGKITNQPSLPLNNNQTNKMITSNSFAAKEKETNNNNYNLHNPNNNKDDKDRFITINDLIGEKCIINLDILRLIYGKYEKSKTSKKKMGIIQSYGVNTYQGIVRHYNEDRVSIIINMNKPKDFNKKWPKISFFGIYDGHGGEGCSEYLRDNLHKLICDNNEFFPENIPEAIRLGFKKAENDFLNNYALNSQKKIVDRSGSCAVIILIVDQKIYVANVGDSRCLLSMDNGKKYIEVTKDHKPNSPNEIKRIKKYGGDIYQTETVMNNINNPQINGKILIGPYRVLPGRLSVSRTIGDAEAKLEQFGDNPNVIISEPEIFFYDLNRNDIDFFILGCDGIYDQISSNEILDCAWMVINDKNHQLIRQCKDIHSQSGLIVDLIMKSALARKSFDNVTCLFVALKDLGMKFNEENKNENNNNNNNINNINENKNIDNNYIAPNISPILTSDKDKNKFQKISMLARKSDTSLNNSNYDYMHNKDNNRFYLSDYRNSYRHVPSYNSDYKVRNGRLNNTTTDININSINDNIISNRNKSNKNNNSTSNRFSNSRANDNPMNYYSKKNQSYSKIANYSYNNENINRHGRDNNSNLVNINNTYLNTNSIKRESEGNINRRTFRIEKVEEKPYINTNTHIFKPLINNRAIKRNENTRKTLTLANNNSTSLYDINRINNSSIDLNNNHPNTTSHRYLDSIQGGKNTNYTSIRKNNINVNRQYKYQNHMNNNNNGTNVINAYSSINSQNNNYLKNQRKNLSLNNVENLNSNNILRNSENKVFNTRMQKNIRQTSLRNYLPNTSFRLSNQIKKFSNSNSNNNIYNSNDPNLKSKYYDKNYQNYTHHTSKNTSFKYSNYFISDNNNNNNKKDYLYRTNRTNNSSNNQGNRYNSNNENSYINYRYNRIKKVNNNENEKNDGKYYYHGY